jgi:aspartate aminotransferase
MELNPRVAAIAPSVTLAVDAKAKAMQAAGQSVCGFGAGEPDFDTPDHIKEACLKALKEGKTKYAPNAGLPDLLAAISEKLKQENGIAYGTDQILVSNGAKHSLYNIFMTLLRDGDEVLLPAPYWVSYLEMIRMAGGVPVLVTADETQDLKVTPAQLRKAVTSRTRLLVLNSPSNPTGAVYSEAELRALAAVAVEHNLTIVSDEIYERMCYDGAKPFSVASIGPEVYNRTITVNGFSKPYAMTGWRLGYAAGPKAVIGAAGALQSHSTSAPNTFAMYGAVAALRGPQECVTRMVAAFDERRHYLYGRLQAMPGVACAKPSGAFYMFPNIKAFGLDSLTFSARLLESEKVAVVPGAAFGADANIRLSYACSMANIREGMDRLERFLKGLKG